MSLPLPDVEGCSVACCGVLGVSASEEVDELSDSRAWAARAGARAVRWADWRRRGASDAAIGACFAAVWMQRWKRRADAGAKMASGRDACG